jgi:DNA-binding MarR family transcriptional regulator
LEARGYAERKAHPVDRRIKVVVITSLGEKAKARALDCLYEPPASFAALTLAEQRQLRDLLAKIGQRAGRPRNPLDSPVR